MTSARTPGYFLACLVIGQLFLSASIRDVRPSLGILPDLMRAEAVDAASFGDRQFLFRYLALQLQNAGDNGGRVTPLKSYDYEKVVAWLSLLDSIDLVSHWPIAMANGYFGQTQKIQDVAPIVRYMQAHVAQDPENKWPWLINGIHLARHRLENNWVALDVARQLSAYDFGQMNSTSMQMYPLVLDDLEQFQRAAAEMIALRERRRDQFSQYDLAWIEDFIRAMAAKQLKPEESR